MAVHMTRSNEIQGSAAGRLLDMLPGRPPFLLRCADGPTPSSWWTARSPSEEGRPLHERRAQARHIGLRVRFVQRVGVVTLGHPGAFLKPCGLLALCDCNNFFVSCERLFRPDLEGVRVVLSSSDGVIISRSNGQETLGIKNGGLLSGARLSGAARGACSPATFSSTGDIGRVMEVLRRARRPSRSIPWTRRFWSFRPQRGTPGRMGRELGPRAEETRDSRLGGRRSREDRGELAAEREQKRPETGGSSPFCREGMGRSSPGCSRGGRVGDRAAVERLPPQTGRVHGPPPAGHADDWLEKYLGVRGCRTAWELRGYAAFP